MLRKLEKNCPTLHAVMTGDDADGVYECECKPDGTMYHGFALKVEVPKELAILECHSRDILQRPTFGQQMLEDVLGTS